MLTNSSKEFILNFLIGKEVEICHFIKLKSTEPETIIFSPNKCFFPILSMLE
jgi:hypothetical protein